MRAGGMITITGDELCAARVLEADQQRPPFFKKISNARMFVAG